MTIGIGIGPAFSNGFSGAGAGGGYDPISLPSMTGIFRGSVGVYQDDARTIPASADNDNFAGWENQVDGAVYHLRKASTSNPGTYKVSGINGRPSLLLDWSEPQFFEITATHKLSDVFTAGGKSLYMVMRRTGTPWSSNPASYLNDVIIADSDLYWGAFLREIGGNKSLTHYNWDGNQDDNDLTPPMVSGDTYVVYLGHNGTNIYVSLNGGTIQSVASGNTASLAASTVRLFTPATFNGTFEVSELWMSNAFHADADRDVAIAGAMQLAGLS